MRKRIKKDKIKVYGAVPTKNGKIAFQKGVLVFDLNDPKQKYLAELLKASPYNKDNNVLR